MIYKLYMPYSYITETPNMDYSGFHSLIYTTALGKIDIGKDIYFLHQIVN